MRNSKICQPFSSAGRMDDGRLNIELEVSQSLRLPPVQLNRELPNEVGSGESNNNSNNTILAESTLVFGLAETGDGTPRMLHPEKDLLTSPLGECHQLTANHSIRLVAWKLSGDASKTKGFRVKSSSCYYPHQERTPTLHISRRGSTGVIGAIDGILIPCIVV